MCINISLFVYIVGSCCHQHLKFYWSQSEYDSVLSHSNLKIEYAIYG